VRDHWLDYPSTAWWQLHSAVVLEIALKLHIKTKTSYNPFQGLRLKECELTLLYSLPLKNYDAGRKRLKTINPACYLFHYVSEITSPLQISIKRTKINWL